MFMRFLVVAAIFALAACSDENSSQGGSGEKTIVIKFPHVTAPATPKGQGADLLKKLVDERLGGRVRIDVFPAGQLMSDDDSLESRAFGEVQLASLVRNVMPESSFSFQHTLTNGTRVDCMLFLPEPSGDIAIDSKFPLESYKKMTDLDLGEADRLTAEKQFRKDIKKHIYDIANKYIISGETSDGAVMFIPAEAIFAEIHSHYYELVEEAQRARVWLVSPTTLMAVLTTARAVLKDSATRKQVHLIQDHLVALSKDFSRFQTRMDNLSRHIEQASKDVDDVNTSARKISSRFEKIEQVEMIDAEVETLLKSDAE